MPISAPTSRVGSRTHTKKVMPCAATQCEWQRKRGFTIAASQTHADRPWKQRELQLWADTCVAARAREEPVLARVRGWRGGCETAPDWRRTVKLPFVREKQEASCGRPSPDGWEDTAGRMQGRGRLRRRPGPVPRNLFGLSSPSGGPSPSQYHYFSHMYQS